MKYLDEVDLDSDCFDIVSEATVGQKSYEICVFVEKTRPSVYHVCVNGVVMHPELDANGAIRALSHYLMSYGNKDNRLKMQS